MSWTLTYQLVVAVMTSFGGGATIVWLMSGWLGRVWAARILEETRSRFARDLEGLKQQYNREIESLRAENDRVAKSVQAELDKTVYVTKANFDVELAALKVVWKELKRLQLALNALRPTYSTAPAGETEQERQKRLQEKLSKNMEVCASAYNAALSAVEDQCPFYLREIYETATEAVGIARLEQEMILINPLRFTANWFIDGTKNQKDFSVCMWKLEQAVRNRMEKLAVRA